MHNFSCDPRVGIGLRYEHLNEILQHTPAIGWLEIHSEDWMSEHGAIPNKLAQVRANYPLSLHGVGLSLGSAEGIDRHHLEKLARLAERSNPILISEHLSWGATGGVHSNDLLPLPYTPEAITVLANNIDCVQQRLGRSILIENLSSYCAFSASCMPEWEFLARVLEAADCRLLLDINNVYVSAHNQHFEPEHYFNGLPLERVEEVHLAGHEVESKALVDTHSRPVCEAVWALYESLLPKLSHRVRTLVEWDSDLPPLSTLLQEAEKAHWRLLEHQNAVA